MNRLTPYLPYAIVAALALSVLGLVVVRDVYAASQVQPNLATLIDTFTRNATRPPIFNGDATVIDSDNSGSNLSAALNPWTTYCLQCDDDAYFEQGPDSAAAEAGDLWVAAGAILRFTTDSARIYVAVLNKTSATLDCQYVECR